MRSPSLYHSRTGPGQSFFGYAKEGHPWFSLFPASPLRHAFIIVFILAATVLWQGAASAAPRARITNMTVNSINNSILLYFDVDNAFNDKLTIAVNSGMNISFSFPVNIYLAKKLWKDRKITQIDLTNTIKYDALKKEYIVTRHWRNPEPVKVSSFEEAAALMTRIEGLNLSQVKGLVKGETYTIRVKATMNKVTRPKYLNFVLFFLDSWKLETGWNAVSFIY